MFFVILTILLLLIQYVALKWTCVNIQQPSVFAWAKLLPPLAVLLFIGAMYISRRYDGLWPDIAGTTAYIWLGWAFIWFSLSMVFMTGQIVLSFFKIYSPFNLGWPVFILSLLIAALSVFNGFSKPVIKEVNIISPDLKTDKITIVQISDSHIGQSVTPNRVRKLIKQIQNLNPDLVVFTGDIFEHTGLNTQAYIDAIKELNPVYGKIGVLGNHEYYGGANTNLEIWEKAGITPLLNEGLDIEPMRIIGVNDIRVTRMGKEEFVKIIQKNKAEGFKLLLSHTPLYFEEAAANDVNLMLSGHTHNGQIWPFKYLTALQFKYTYGLYPLGKSNIYVTSGTFYWGPPMRFLTKNELPFITITKQ